MKKLLFQFDTDEHPAVFDTVVAYDGGADHVSSFGGITPFNVGSLVEGAIFTRAPKDKKNTAIFIGGSSIIAGQELLAAVQQKFFMGFKVSVMIDCNGCNTTAAAGVATLATNVSLQGKKAVVLAGTGPVGQRAAVMLALEGAEVTLTSRQIYGAEEACYAMQKRYGVNITAAEAPDCDRRGEVIKGAQIVFAAGAAGVELLRPEHWEHNRDIEIMIDANATPPLGIGGADMMDRGFERHGKVIWGAIGFGNFKLALHRICIAKLFEDNNQILDAENIYAIAKQMSTQGQ